MGTGISGIAGALSAGIAGDRVRNRLRLCAVVSLMASGPLFVAFAMEPGAVAATVVLAMIGYGLLQMYYGLVYASIQDLAAPPQRATAMATYLMVTYLGGASWGPMVMGRVSDMVARKAADTGPLTEAARATGLHGAMFLIPTTAVILSLVLSVAARRTAAANPLPANCR
jgi:MFS family permease